MIPDITTNHTPGPWSYRNNGEDYSIEADKKTLAYVRVSDHWDLPHIITDQESKANAQLIAAAPNLLEAAIAVCEAFDLYEDSGAKQLYQLKQAIIKATQ